MGITLIFFEFLNQPSRAVITMLYVKIEIVNVLFLRNYEKLLLFSNRERFES
jgi:hypothetical protein